MVVGGAAILPTHPAPLPPLVRGAEGGVGGGGGRCRHPPNTPSPSATPGERGRGRGGRWRWAVVPSFLPDGVPAVPGADQGAGHQDDPVQASRLGGVGHQADRALVHVGGQGVFGRGRSEHRCPGAGQGRGDGRGVRHVALDDLVGVSGGGWTWDSGRRLGAGRAWDSGRTLGGRLAWDSGRTAGSGRRLASRSRLPHTSLPTARCHPPLPAGRRGRQEWQHTWRGHARWHAQATQWPAGGPPQPRPCARRPQRRPLVWGPLRVCGFGGGG